MHLVLHYIRISVVNLDCRVWYSQARQCSPVQILQEAVEATQQVQVPQIALEAHPTAVEPSMSLEAVVALVLATASEISGSELEEGAHFADHHFDSLAAVELSNSIGKAVGLALPSACLFPSPLPCLDRLFE